MTGAFKPPTVGRITACPMLNQFETAYDRGLIVDIVFWGGMRQSVVEGNTCVKGAAAPTASQAYLENEGKRSGPVV